MSNLVYVCNYLSEKDFGEQNVRNCGPAANEKISDICNSLISVGVTTTIVSSRIGSFSNSNFYEPIKIIKKDIGVVYYCPRFKARYLNRLLLPFLLLYTYYQALSSSPVNHYSVSLFYNRQPYYWAVLVFTLFYKLKVVFDIEDEYSILEKRSWFYHVIMKVNTKFTSFFENDGKLVVANMAISENSNYQRLACYGAVSIKKRPLINNGIINFFFCGTINDETGSSLLLKAIQDIELSDWKSNIKLNISGFGEDSDLIEDACHGLSWVVFHGNISRLEYDEILKISNVGISLKRPGNYIGATTFPSKVVEFVKNGLAVISYELNDVKSLLGSNAYWLNDKNDLYTVIKDIVSNESKKPSEIASEAQSKLMSEMGYLQVGMKLKEFLEL